MSTEQKPWRPDHVGASSDTMEPRAADGVTADHEAWDTAELAMDTSTSELPWMAGITGTLDIPVRSVLESGGFTLTDPLGWADGTGDGRRDSARAWATSGAQGPDELIGVVVGGRYRIVAAIGRGGMSAVYRAEHVALGKPVAVKVLAPRLASSPEHVEQFVHEARTTAMLRHPNVIDVIDVGHLERDGRPYLVMALLEGEDLHAILRREQRLSWRRTREIALQLCAALTAAHGRGIIHRDIKPHNVFAARAEESERFVLLDFGIAKRTTNQQPGALTLRGDLFGTVEYLSPERITEQSADRRSDVYSLGVLLFRMLAGQVPFRNRDPVEVARAHLEVEPPRFDEVAPGGDIPPALEAIVRRALAKRPGDRFQSAAELADALRAVSPADFASGASSASERAEHVASSGSAGSAAFAGREIAGPRADRNRRRPLAPPRVALACLAVAALIALAAGLAL